jgi:uncharacterized protein (TIGR02677 family)
LVGYVGERLESLERRARPISALLDALTPRIPVLVARARDGLAARVADAGLDGVRVRPEHGSTAGDWENLSAWFRSRPSAPSRVATLGRDAVNAVRTLTQNLMRLSRSGVGGLSRRADYLSLATFFDDAGRTNPSELPRLAAAAFGLFACRHLGAAAGDDTDPVAVTTSWWDAPPAHVPVSLRERGDTTNRGRSGQVQDRSLQRGHLLARRRADEERAAAVRSELLAAAGPDGALADGVVLPERALAVLQRLLGPALAAMGPGRVKGETEVDGLRCVVERRPGESTTVHTPVGALRLMDLTLSISAAQEE